MGFNTSIKAGSGLDGEGYVNEALTQDEGAALCFDVLAYQGLTAFDGSTISAAQAVTSFFARPSLTNGRYFAGVAEQQIVQGDQRGQVAYGPTEALVRNNESGSITLAVGDTLVQVPGQSYFVPVFQAVAAGGTRAQSNHAGLARALVRVSTVIASATTVLTPVYVFFPSPPHTESLHWFSSGAFSLASAVTVPMGIARGYGRILRAGFGFQDCGSAGNCTLDVQINGTTIFSTSPMIANDGDNFFHTLRDYGASGAGAGYNAATPQSNKPGTSGSYGTINTAANILAPNDRITAVLTGGGGAANQAGPHVQVDVEYL